MAVVLGTALAAGAAAGPAAAVPGDGGAPPSFLKNPTDQLGVPGMPDSAELTPSGSLFTGRMEMTVRVGRRQRPWDQPRRTLDPRGLPVFTGQQRVDGLDHRITAFAVDANGVPTVHYRIQIRNRSGRVQDARLGLDVGWLGKGVREIPPGPGQTPRAPYRFPRPDPNIPGEAFQAGWTYAWRGTTLERSGSPLLRASVTRRATAAGGRGLRVAGTSSPARRRDAVGAQLRIDGPIAARGLRTVDVVVPMRAVPADAPALRDGFDAARRRLVAAWKPALARAMSVQTPEPAVDRAWRNGVLAMLVPRIREADGRWLQAVNKFQYQASWIRDTAMIAHTLNLVNLGREAAEDVEYLTMWQDASGLLQSRTGQLDGMGQALWSFGDVTARAKDPALAQRLLPAAEAAMGWVNRRLTEDPQWILPASDPHDNELAAGHNAGDLAWLAGGTRRVVEVARIAGRPELAAAWSSIADRVDVVVRARVTEAARNGVVPSVLDNPVGQRWGEMWLAWPTGFLAPTDPLVRATMAAAAKDEVEGLARWSARLHLYLGLRRHHTELLAGRPAVAVSGLYATLAHLTSTGGTWEQASRAGGRRDAMWALGPHAWGAADMMSLLHDMLVREEGDGVRLLDAVPASWLRAGSVTRVRRAVTIHGSVDLTLKATSRGATLSWNASTPDGVPLRFRAPAAVTDVRLPGVAPGVREIVLPGRSGSLQLGWRTGAAVAKAKTAESVQNALRRSYARHGDRW